MFCFVLIISVCRYILYIFTIIKKICLCLFVCSGPILVDLVHCLTEIMSGSGDLPGEYFFVA